MTSTPKLSPFYIKANDMLCIICDADMNIYGYTYGACNACVKKALKQYAKIARPKRRASTKESK